MLAMVPAVGDRILLGHSHLMRAVFRRSRLRQQMMSSPMAMATTMRPPAPARPPIAPAGKGLWVTVDVEVAGEVVVEMEGVEVVLVVVVWEVVEVVVAVVLWECVLVRE